MDEKSILLLGEINAKVEVLGERVGKMDDALKETNANVGQIAKMCASRAPLLKDVEAHMEKDRPLEEVFGKHLLKVLWGAAGAAGMFFLERLMSL